MYRILRTSVALIAPYIFRRSRKLQELGIAELKETDCNSPPRTHNSSGLPARLYYSLEGKGNAERFSKWFLVPQN
jgi:hypothetical protein